MKTLWDIKNYAKEKGLSDRIIEEFIDGVVSDGDGNVTEEEYENTIFGIDCEMEDYGY